MGLLVKEILKRICVETGWSYAVFWKGIPCGNQIRHFVFEDGHCEQASTSKAAASGFEAIDMLIKESGVLRGSHKGGGLRSGNQVEDRVRVLVFELMATQVHVVGAGIVGKAALSGKHEWVLGDMLSQNDYISKGMVDIRNQVLAGVKTVAIIPVLPHGVLQLGSTCMVLENFGFVNRVKGLFEQIYFMPGVLSFENTRKCLGRNIQQLESIGMQTSVQFVDSVTSGNNFSFLKEHNFTCQYFGPRDSKIFTEPCACSQHDGEISDSVPEVPLSQGKMSGAVMLSNSLSQPIRQPAINSILYQNNQLGNERLIKNVLPCDSNSVRQHQLPLELSYNRLTFLESQLLSMSGVTQTDIAELTPHKTNMLGLQPNGCTSLNPHQGSEIISTFGSDQLIKTVEDQCDSFRYDTESLRSQFVDSSFKKAPQVINPIDLSTSSQNISGVSEQSHLTSIRRKSTSISSTDKQKTSKGLIQALEVQPIQFDHGGSCHNSLGSLKNNKGGVPNENNIKDTETLEFQKSLREKISYYPQASSGNDLFLMLCPDQYKSRFSQGSLENVITYGTDANAHELSTDVSTCITELEVEPIYNAFNDETGCSSMFLEAGSDQLLDAVVSQFNSSANLEIYDKAPCKSSSEKISSSSLHTNPRNDSQVASPNVMRAKTFGHPPVLVETETTASSSAKSSCSLERTDGCFSERNGDCKSQINSWITNGQKLSCDNYSVAPGKKVVEAGKPNRKRSRADENPRPRPKDRQMIQDRVKELREIVPSGAKCSIDALLEKTIKHMLFLQSVTKHADKLKETGEPKIISNEEGLLLKDNFAGGATWAFEVGSKSMICPIVVEDLNPPRQMLVEMLCEERGMFLEIADLVRGLGLTILKGVMESRNGKVWARFAVEANRDITRMELFLSLVQLLEPSMISSKAPETVDNLNKPQNPYPSPSSIPAAAFSDRFW